MFYCSSCKYLVLVWRKTDAIFHMLQNGGGENLKKICQDVSLYPHDDFNLEN